jgi:ketosteroid isomerase-like protein
MSEQDLQLAQEGYGAWNRGDLDWLLEHVTEDIEVHPMRHIDQFGKVYRGKKGWIEFWEVWHEVWPGTTIKVHRLEDLGEHGVLVLLSFDGDAGELGQSSVPVTHWITFREGKFASVTAMAPETAERRREART